MAQKLWEKNVQVDHEVDIFTVGKDREMDLYLAKYDVLGSMAHITMLESIGLLTKEELNVLLAELRNIYAVADRGEFIIEEGIEDVHSQVELMLTRRLGDMGKKIHSGRSRNDQVLLDLKLFTRSQIQELVELVSGLFDVLISQSNRYKDVLLPGYTHLQVAMPSSFGLWFGAYHFTTLVPNLGMVTTSDGRSFAAADLPGLIEGASQGVGLGTQFLRHIERTRVILHVIDMSGMEGRDPYEDYLAINKELSTYNLRLLERPQIIVANKMDMPDAQENLVKFKEQLNKEKEDEFADDIPVFPISGVTRQGLDALLNATADLLEVTPEFPLYEEELEEETVHYGFNPEGPEFQIDRDSDATWILSGEKIEKLFQMTNFDHDETVMRFARQLRGMGVDEALRARGAKDGDLVRIGEFEFEFVE